MDKFEKGTILHTIQPNCQALLPTMRKAKDDRDVSVPQIANATGVTAETLKRFFNGTQKKPCVYKIAALCHYFGLSMDVIFGLSPSASELTNTALEEKDAELQNAKEALATRSAEYEGRIAQYQKLLAESKDDKTQLVESLKKRNASLAEKEQDYKNELKALKEAHKEEIKYKNRVIRILGTALAIFVVLVLHGV